MFLKKNFFVSAFAILSFSALLLRTDPSLAQSAYSAEDYEKALQIAQRKVRREAQSQAGALSAAPASRLIGRFYEPGETWEIAVWRTIPTQMRRTSDPEHLKAVETPPAIFKFEVAEVKHAAGARVTLRVQELGSSPVDPLIDFLQLELDPRLLQTKKSYQLRRHAKLISVSPDGIRSGMTPLELLPLDFPNMLTARQSAAKMLPELPAHIARAAKEFGFSPDLTRSTWLEQDDFFGRPVVALWQHGDPWPAYLKTAHGTAILIRTGGAR